jgi:hypothetical protein
MQVAFPTKFKLHPIITIKMANKKIWAPENHKAHCEGVPEFATGESFTIGAVTDTLAT